jgi:hypothetical protein
LKLGSNGGAGGGPGTPRDGGGRAVAKDAVLARACAGCGQHIKKIKRSLGCSCKLAVYCSFECQQSSDHRAACLGSEQRNPCLDKMDNREKFCKWIS